MQPASPTITPTAAPRREDSRSRRNREGDQPPPVAAQRTQQAERGEEEAGGHTPSKPSRPRPPMPRAIKSSIKSRPPRMGKDKGTTLPAQPDLPSATLHLKQEPSVKDSSVSSGETLLVGEQVVTSHTASTVNDEATLHVKPPTANQPLPPISAHPQPAKRNVRSTTAPAKQKVGKPTESPTSPVLSTSTQQSAPPVDVEETKTTLEKSHKPLTAHSP